jgi:uncharacterized membrane protein
MVDDWLLLGLAAALSYSVSGLATKLALDKRYAGLEPTAAAALVAAGVVIAYAAFYLIFAGAKVPQLTLSSAAAGLAVGFFWALGSIMVYYAIMRGADVSRMAPIYNMNTLVVVLGAILLLHELPDKSQVLKVVVGAALIVAGGILVSG